MHRLSSSSRSRTRQRGNSIIEFCLVLPWLILLFTGVFDFGFYCYAFISVKNAARVAVLHAAANTSTAADQSGACQLVTQEMSSLPNIGSAFSTTCSGSPLTVTASYCAGSSTCGSATSSADSGPAALVTVAYQMPVLFRMPIKGISIVTQSAEMRLRDTLQ